MKRLLSLTALAAVLCGFSPVSSAASTIAVGSVPAANAWSTIEFTFGGGALNIDMLSGGWGGGPTGFGVDDIYITLMTDNNSPFTAFTGAFVGANDDSGATFGDGSVTTLDSFLSLGALGAGDYVLFISHCCNMFTGSTNSASGIHTDGLGNVYGDWQATFSQDVDVTAINGVSEVPEPSTMLLMGAGLVGLGVRQYRRRRT